MLLLYVVDAFFKRVFLPDFFHKVPLGGANRS